MKRREILVSVLLTYEKGEVSTADSFLSVFP